MIPSASAPTYSNETGTDVEIRAAKKLNCMANLQYVENLMKQNKREQMLNKNTSVVQLSVGTMY